MTELKRIKRAKEILDICYETESDNLNQEIASIERGQRGEIKDVETIIDMVDEIQTTLEIFSDEIEHDDYLKIEELILELTEIE